MIIRAIRGFWRVEMPTFFDRIAIIGLACFLLLWFLTFFGVALDWVLHVGETMQRFFSIALVSVLVVFTLSGGVLWVRSLLWMFKRWKNRELLVNLRLLALAVCMPLIAGFILHYLERREHERTPNRVGGGISPPASHTTGHAGPRPAVPGSPDG